MLKYDEERVQTDSEYKLTILLIYLVRTIKGETQGITCIVQACMNS